MPDDRFFHKRAGHSDKVNALTDFEELVWRYYVLSSDDFGVMRFDHRQIQNDHERAGKKPAKVIQKALARIAEIQLVHVFEHQGRAYCYSRNWQRFQKVDYPRETINPCPLAADLAHCEESTQFLFLQHPGGKFGREKKHQLLAEHNGDYSAAVRRMMADSVGDDFLLTRAGALAQAKAEGLGQGQRLMAERASGSTLPERAGAFAQWYSETHERLLNLPYVGNPHRDYSAALEIVRKCSDQDARDAALVWFGMDDKWATDGTRSIPKFASRASDCLLRARKVSA